MKVLLVEDDDDHAKLFEKCAAAAGVGELRLSRAPNLATAKQLCTDPTLDVIVLDPGLPETQGAETIVAILKQEPVAPVIVLTSSDDLELGMSAIRLGAQDYLFKGDLKPRVVARSIRYAIERARMVSELHQANVALSLFASAAAHDLKAPLRHITSYLGLIEQQLEGQLSEQTASYFGHVTSSAQRLRTLIDSLLQFARTEQKLNTQPCSFLELAREAQANLAEEIERANALLQLPDQNFTVHGDRLLLVRVLENLLGNALKYVAGKAPSVRIEIKERENDHFVSVTDNGIGIEAVNLEKIFQPLARLHAQGEYAGSGIGLAIARRIVTAHGGQIWASSTEGSGSTFSFTIPKQGPAMKEGI